MQTTCIHELCFPFPSLELHVTINRPLSEALFRVLTWAIFRLTMVTMVGEMVENSQSLYSFTFNAVIVIHEYIYFIHIQQPNLHSRNIFIQWIQMWRDLVNVSKYNYICSHLRDLFTFNPQFVVYPRLTICSLQSTVCSPQSAFYTSTDHLSWLYNMYSVQ